MKRIVSVILFLVLFCGSTIAEEVTDFSFLDNMTLEQMEQLAVELNSRIEEEKRRKEIASTFDYGKMTEEELQSVIDKAREAMVKYHPIVENETVLYSDESISIIYTGEMRIEKVITSDSLVIDVIITNSSENNIFISFNRASCNGWSVLMMGTSIPAGQRVKSTFVVFDIREKTDIENIDDVEEIKAKFSYCEHETRKGLIENVNIVWTFNQ